MPFGDLKGGLTASVNSVTNPTNATGSVFVETGDLIWVTFAQQTALTAGTVTDNLGNTYTAVNAGTDAGNVTQRCYFSRVTVIGTLTSVSVAATASTNDASCSVDVIEGPVTTSPLDANPANATDATSPFTCPATGVLAQANEIVMAGISVNANTTVAATSPSLIGTTVARANASCGNSRRVVTATTSVTPEFTGTSAAAVQTTASFRQDTTAARKQHDWPNPKEPLRANDLRTWTYNLTITLPEPEPPVEFMGFPVTEWQPAPAPERSVELRTWTYRPFHQLPPPAPAVQFMGLPVTEWQPPLGPEYDESLRTWVQNPITLRAVAPRPVGKQLYDRPDLGPLQPLRSWTASFNLNLRGQDFFPPGREVLELPPRGYPEPATRTWTWSYNLNLIGQDRLPVGEQRTDLPPRDFARPTQVRTWIWSYNLNLVGKDELPPGKELYDLPERGAPPITRGWTQSLQQSTLAPQAATPFSQSDWPLRPGPEQPLRSWTHSFNLNLIGQDVVPGTQHTELPPKGPLQPLRSWTWSYNLNLIAQDRLPVGKQVTDLPPRGHTWHHPFIFYPSLALNTPPAPKPFNQQDWPLRPGPAQPDRAFATFFNPNLRGQDRLPVGKQVTELPPRAYPEPATRTWTWSYNLNLVGRDRLPAGEQVYERPSLGHIHPNQLRTWTQTFNPNLRGQDQLPVGEQSYALPPTGHIHPNQIRTWIQSVNLALNTQAATLPFSQKDWPNPRPLGQPDRSFASFFNPNLRGQDRLPTGKSVYDLPPRAHLPEGKTWIGRTIALLNPPEKPVGQAHYDLPPRGYPLPPNWNWQTNVNLLNAPVAALPFNQKDWPNPRGHQWPIQTWIHFTPLVISTLVEYGGVPSSDWPPAPPHPYPMDLRSWTYYPATLRPPTPPSPVVEGRERGPFTPGWEWQAWDRLWDKRWYEDHVGHSEVS